ncbi:coproporphyrinogen III oxidase [Fusobacterium pseudoperiodonticum]|uniref:coproporphyrinogen III oxidase n=1 Tax=Fusobacterium pseudoperiodonticum TaxID=2663009 RepID=UPI000C1BE981|nr:coproporphyrinogen III oxidase [Fusobacterium pseudoperiodonticum]ATV72865.1 coproporphyrinogen III oxidase [Fusobacterium pseudoperiodonticum]
MLVYSFEISEREKVYLSAGVIATMFDSLKSLRTLDKLKIKKNKGLFYKGSTYIEKENISKLKKIVSSWKGLFSEATQNFVLIGFFNTKIDDYERWNCNKEEVIESLEKLNVLCEKAEKENKIIRCRKLTVKLADNRGER